jgi:RHS repeat-associated protein
LILETLEERVLPAPVFWNVDANGSWDLPGNWSSGAVPGAADDVFLDRPAGAFTITHAAGDITVNSIHASRDALTVAGGTFTIAAASELSDFSFASLVLNSSLTTSGAVNWSTGKISSALDPQGKPINSITNNGTLTLAGAGDWTVAAQVVNAGTIIQDGGNLAGNQGSIVNLGTIQKSTGAGTATISTPVNNAGGTLQAQAGTLALTGGGTFTGGAFGAATGAFLDLDTSHIAFSGTFTGSGTGLVRLRNGMTLGATGATFNFNGQWLNGTWTLGDTGLTNLGTLAIVGTSAKPFSGVFTNAGTILHQGTGNLQIGYPDFNSDHPGTLNNTTNGVYDFQADASFINGTNVPLDNVNNAGVIRKSAGAGGSGVFPAVNYKSTAGAFDIRSGTFTLQGGGVFTGGGSFAVSAGAALEVTGTNFTPTTMSGAFTGSGAGTVRLTCTSLVVGAAGTTFDFTPGLLQWSAVGQSTISGADLTNLGSITLAGTGLETVSNAFYNAGTIVHAGSGHLRISFGFTLTNLVGAVYDFQADQSADEEGTFINRGTVRKSGGAGTSSLIARAFQNEGGTIDVQHGTLAIPNGGGTGGAFSVATNAVLDLTPLDNFAKGIYSGTYTGSGPGTIQLRLLGPSQFGFGLNVSGATFNLPAGMFQWLGGTINCGTTGFNNTGSITLAGADAKFFGGVLNNAGTIVHAGTGGLNFSLANTTVNNLPGGLYDLQGDVNFFGNGSGYSTFNNAGTLRKSAGTGTSTSSFVDVLNVGGTIDVRTGEFLLKGFVNPALAHTGGDFRVAHNAVLELGDSTSRGVFQGSYTGSGDGVVRFETGILAAGTGGATFNFSTGLFQWTGGLMDGRTAPLTNDGSMALLNVGLQQPQLEGALNNAGAIAMVGQTTLVLGNEGQRGVLTNLANGLFDFPGDAGQVSPQRNSGGTFINDGSTFINQGTLRKSSGSGTATINTFFFDNSGTLAAAAGTVRIASPTIAQVAGTTLTGGTWQVSAGCTIDLAAAAAITANNAQVVLDGPGSTFLKLNTLAANVGSLSFLNGRSLTTTGAFSNTGALTVGVGSTLAVMGNYTQSTAAALNVQLGGAPDSGQFGQVTCTGNAALAGALNVSLVGGFGATAGQTFPVMSFAGSSGAFDTTTGLTFGKFTLFTAQLNPTNLVLTSVTTSADLAFDSFGGTFPTTAKPGANAAITYTVKNLSGPPVTGDWYDSVYLSRDGALDPGDALLGRVHHVGDVAGLSSYTETLTAPLPTLADGGYHVIVLADSRGLVPDANRPNNTGVSAATLAATVPALALGTPVTGTITNGQDIYYRVVVPPGQGVTFGADFTVPQQADFFLRAGDLPDRSNFDQSDTSGALGPRLMVSNAQGGSYYVLLHGREGAAGGTSFTLSAEASEFAIVRLSTLRGSNQGDATIDLLGAKFTAHTQISLVRPGSTVAATTVDFIDPNHLSATFNLRGVNTGIYQVQAKDADQTATSADTFLVTDIAAGALHVDMTAPAVVRTGDEIGVSLSLENLSDSNVRLPFLVLGATNVTVDAAKQEFLGGPNLPKILPPHFEADVTIPLYTPDPKGPGVKSDFNLSVINPTEVTIDWEAQKANLRPKSIPADAWDAIWANFRPQLGDTLEDFYALLSGDFRALGQSTGLAIRSVARLFAFELRLANDLPALPVPAGGTDLAFPAPGLPLTFGRSFGSSIAGRYYVGRLGRGWVDNFDISASADADTGLVTIRQGGNLRFFARNPDGSYSGVPGDFATLTLTAGASRLRESSGEVTAFRSDGQLAYLQDTNNNRLTAGYTGSQLTSITNTNGSALTFHYNAQGRIDLVTDPAGRVANYAYDATGEHLISVTTTAGTIEYGYTSETSGPRAFAITSISYPDGTHLFFDYDNRGRLVSHQQDGAANALSFTYDIANYRVTDALGNSTYIYYDDVGRTSLRVDGVGPNIGDGGPVTSTSYDDVTNRLAQIQPPDGPPVTFSYDERGNPTQVTDPQGQTQHFTYESSFNHLTSWKDALGHETTYDQDPNGNLSTTTYVDGSTEQFSYDAQGNPVSAVNRLGQPISETYDPNGLVKTKDFADGTHLAYEYDAHGNMISATGPAGATIMEYDLADRMAKITYPGGRFLQFIYNAGGQRISTIDQSGFTTNYRYDAVGRLAEVTDGLGQSIVAYDYDPAGRLARETRGNGTFTTYEYDRLGQILHLVNSGANNTILSRFDYTYDVLGRRDSMTTLEGKTTYAYDAANQLASVTLPDGRTISYAYDAAGNRQLVTDNGAVSAYTTNALNEYVTVGGADLTYDAGGNLTAASGSNSYSYDAQGQLLSAITPQGMWTYEYDALGNRIASTHNGVRTEYLIDPMGNVVGQYDGAGSLEAHYVQGLGLASRVDAMNQSDYYEFDALGNTAQLTGPDGTVLNSYSYLPFGESLSASESVANPFTFVGQLGVMREGNGLDFMRSRWYEAAQGRFTQPDPIGLAGGTNLYAYVGNNPANLVDPHGLNPNLPPNFGQLGLVNPLGKTLSPEQAARINVGVAGAGGKIAENAAEEIAGLEAAHAAENARFLGSPNLYSPTVPVDPLAQRLPVGADYAEYASQVEAARTAQTAQEAEAAAAVARGAETASSAGKGAGLAAGFAVVEGAAAVIIAGIAIAEDIEAYESGGLPPGVIDVRKYLTGDVLFDALIHYAYGSNPVGAGILAIKNIHKFFASTEQVNPHSHDPNNIVGPAGFGTEGFVDPQAKLPYVINFENAPNAGGPATEISVTQQLDPNLDLDTFELGNFGFGDLTISVPAGRQYYHTRVDLRQLTTSARQNLFVDVTAELNRETRVVTWTFTSLDPATLDLPIDPFVGFLPPDQTAPEGEGFVSYSVRPRTDSPTGTRIGAQASIVFDANDPVLTPQIFNTIDAGPPTSSVSPLPEFSPGTFTVNWAGQDDADGSGVAAYDVFVSDNGGPFTAWQTSTAELSAPFTGVDGHTYAFYSVATDNIGNVQPAAGLAQSTTVDAMAPSTSASLSGTQGENGWYTTPVSVTLAAADTASGVAQTYYSLDDGSTWLTYSTPITISAQGSTTVAFYSADNAGNSEAVQSVSFAIDTTPPVLTLPANQMFAATQFRAALVTYTGATATDNLTAPSLTYSQASGTEFPLGATTIQVTATDAAGNLTHGTFTITVNRVAAERLTVDAPAQVYAAGRFSVAVRALDPFGDVAPQYNASVALLLEEPTGKGKLSGAKIAPVENGTATFDNLSVDIAGTYTLLAASNGDLIAAIAPITVVVPSVQPTTATHLALGTDVKSAAMGQTVTVSVTPLDRKNRTVDFHDVVQFTSTDPLASLPAATVFVAGANGAMTFSVILKTPGKQTVTMTDLARRTLTASASVTVAATNMSTATHLGVAADVKSPIMAGNPVIVTVTGLNNAGKGDSQFADNLLLTTSDKNAIITAQPVVNGIATFSVTLFTAGNQTVRVIDLTRMAVKGPSVAIRVTARAASQLAVTGFPSTILAGVVHAFSVMALDQYGNRITAGFADTVTVAGMTYRFTPADHGVHVFTTALAASGTASLTAADVTPDNSVMPGSETNIAVIDRSLAVSIGPPAFDLPEQPNGVPGQPLPFTLSAGQVGIPTNTMFTYRVDWSGNGQGFQTVTGHDGLTVSHAYPATGAYTIKLTVLDAAGDVLQRATRSAVIRSVALEADPAGTGDTALVTGAAAAGSTILIAPSTSAVPVAVSINGAAQPIAAPPSPIGRIIVFGQGGNDSIQETDSVGIAAILFGGGGTNVLSVAGSGADNILVGGPGKNILVGGNRRDILIGGGGAANLIAGRGGDILVGGSTTYDANLSALIALMSEWASGDGYAQRVHSVFGHGDGGQNGFYVLSTQTVRHQTSASRLSGGTTGADWFWFSDASKSPDRISGYGLDAVATFLD